jgi:hypothetical protein
MDQILCCLFVALTAAAGPQAKAIADRVILGAIADGSVDDQEAVEFLRSLIGTAGDTPELTPTSLGIH